MIESLRVAIAGAGLMGRWHAAYGQRNGAVIGGVADLDVARARRLAAKFQGAAAYASFEEMLVAGRLDAIHLCTPAAFHAPMARQALEAGVHLLVEKPLAGTAAECRALLALAAARGLCLVPAHQFLFQRGIAKARFIERIRHLDATFCSAGGAGVSGSRLDEIAAEILPHPLALFERLRPGCLDLADWRVMRPSPGEWRVCAATGDISLSILISLRGRPTEASLRITGEDATAEWDLFHGYCSLDSASASRVAKIARPFRIAARRFGNALGNAGHRLAAREFAYPGLRQLIAEFYSTIRRGGPRPIASAETMAVARARDAIMGRSG